MIDTLLKNETVKILRSDKINLDFNDLLEIAENKKISKIELNQNDYYISDGLENRSYLFDNQRDLIIPISNRLNNEIKKDKFEKIYLLENKDRIIKKVSEKYNSIPLCNILKKIYEKIDLDQWYISKFNISKNLSKYEIRFNQKNNISSYQKMIILKSGDSGNSRLNLDIGIFKLICSNGMVDRLNDNQDYIKKSHLNININDFNEKIDYFFDSLNYNYDKFFDLYKNTQRILINPKDLLNKIADKEKIIDKIPDIYNLYLSQFSKYDSNLGNLRSVIDTFTEYSHQNFKPLSYNYQKYENIGNNLLQHSKDLNLYFSN